MSMQVIRRVGIIGLGKMGLPMSRHLRRRGFDVIAHDVNAAACKQAESHDVVVADSARAVAAASDFVIVVVGFDSEAERAVMGKDGIGAALPSPPPPAFPWKALSR